MIRMLHAGVQAACFACFMHVDMHRTLHAGAHASLMHAASRCAVCTCMLRVHAPCMPHAGAHVVHAACSRAYHACCMQRHAFHAVCSCTCRACSMQGEHASHVHTPHACPHAVHAACRCQCHACYMQVHMLCLQHAGAHDWHAACMSHVQHACYMQITCVQLVMCNLCLQFQVM